jgi:uncharacterized protein YdaU (DUF1376 family)
MYMINKEINKLREKIDNIKEEGTQDMEDLRKKNETEMQSKNGRPVQQTRTRGTWNIRTRK